ncbi:MAG: hypothetical protein LBJ74_04875 [Heliobacteriaceae bacterium]|jgi:tetratricopeptide (TPR) repeat protein|nr:hypothetical protein [Heliobacteriaceae bacterium]
MKCQTCKKDIEGECPVNCPHCGARTGLVCFSCSAVNRIGNLICEKCGTEILKLCKNCRSVNFTYAKKCRKCAESFEADPNPGISQSSAVNILTKGIRADKKIFSITGPKGSGKSTVFKLAIQELQDENYACIYGKCNSVTQLTPGGLLQDILLNVFNLPGFSIKDVRFKKDASKFFSNEFPDLLENEVLDLINFLYPTDAGLFENLAQNKANTYTFLNKIFDRFAGYGKFVFIIDNFESIDGFSYEFLNGFVRKDNVYGKLKLVMTCEEPKPGRGYFNFEEDNIYIDIKLAPFEEIDMFIKPDEETPISGKAKQAILKISRGNPAYIEHALALLEDCKEGKQPFKLSHNFAQIIAYRLALLNFLNPQAYSVLIAASLIGDKVNLNVMHEVFQLEPDEFQKIIAYLENAHYITPLSDIAYEFKSTTLWEAVVNYAKKDENFAQLSGKMYSFLENFNLNSNTIFALLAQNLKELRLAFEIWTKNTRLTAYIGDINLYIISQKQSLALLNEFDDKDTLPIRYNISERLGRLFADSDPQEALEYLPDAVANAQETGDDAKEVELLGYLASACRAAGNYFGEVECVDKVLEKTQQPLEIVLLKTTKLQALLNIGSCGEIVNIIDNEIMPALDEYLKGAAIDPFLYETWLKTYLLLANALITQGNNRAFEVLTIIFDIIEKHNIHDDSFVCRCKLALAFANTMKGDVKTSERMLEDIMVLYRTKVMDDDAVLRWNFINILNAFFAKQYTGLQEYLFDVVTLANNNADAFTKNVLKSLLGKIFFDRGDIKRALEIYNEQITYFAEEKIALGALLTWYLIAQATLDQPESALEIAAQALEVAQNPKTDNYFFTVLLKMIIAQASMELNDYETAKNNIESAIRQAQKSGLNDLLARLFYLYGEYFNEFGRVKSPEQAAYLSNAAKIYGKALEMAQKLQNTVLQEAINTSVKSLKSFAKLNGIQV